MSPPQTYKFGKIPKHVAIIMDGNGRWAKQKNMIRVQGHRAGAESVRDVVKAAARRIVKGSAGTDAANTSVGPP